MQDLDAYPTRQIVSVQKKEIGLGFNPRSAIYSHHKVYRSYDCLIRKFKKYMYKNAEIEVTMTREELDNIRMKAEQGDAEAQFELGEYYYESTFGDETDIPYEVASSEAVKWFQKAAEQGMAVAQFRLGNCYGQAIGVKCSEEESFKWFRMAADKGLAIAQRAVALHFSLAQKDYQEAAKWYRLAADQGDEFSINELAYYYRNEIGVVKDEEQAAMLYSKLQELRQINELKG